MLWLVLKSVREIYFEEKIGVVISDLNFMFIKCKCLKLVIKLMELINCWDFFFIVEIDIFLSIS